MDQTEKMSTATTNESSGTSAHDVGAGKEVVSEMDLCWRQLVDCLPDAILVHCDGRIVFANTSAAIILGFKSSSDLLGRMFLGLLPPGYRELEESRLQQLGQGALQLSFAERALLRADGTIISTELAMNSLMYGGRRAVQVIIRDRSRRQSPSGENALLCEAVEQCPVSIVISKPTGEIEYTNAKFTQNAGYSKEEVVGKSVNVLKSGETPRENYRGLWERISSGGEWRGEFLNKKKTGELYWENQIISAIKDSAGNITHFIAVNEDITRQKTADAAQRASEDNLRVIFNSVNDAIFLHELNGSIVDVNDKALQMFGVSRKQASTLSLRDDLSAADSPLEELSGLWKRVVLGQDKFFEWKARRPNDGSVFDVEIYLRRISLNGKAAILSAVRDVTERKRMQEQISRAQRIESIATVVGSIAHEFNNTLNNVLGFSTLVRKYVRDEAKVTKYSTAIEQSVMRGADLGNRLLAFARETRRESSTINLGDLINELGVSINKTLGAGIAVEKKIDPQLLQIVGDRNELSQAILNLVMNARDAIGARTNPAAPGHLLIAADNSIVAEQMATKLMIPAGSPCIVLRISDNGAGIPEDIRERIFDPFFTTKERKGGAGLGLSIVFSAVRSHRGTILVESELERGTTVQIFLPALDAKKLAELDRESRSLRKKSEMTVLLADDDAAMREYGADILESEGYKVIAVSDGAEAVEVFKKSWKEINLVILDLIMPKLDGGQAYLELKKINPSVKSIFCTGYASDNIISQLLEEENIRALQKPFIDTDFKRIVHEVIEGE